MPLSPGGVIPRDMDARQWDRFVAQSGIQADKNVKTFTPTWSGFSSDPVGDISYMDFGAIVMMWASSALIGTSDDVNMVLGGIPESLMPSSAKWVSCLVLDGSTTPGVVLAASAFIQSAASTSESMAFSLHDAVADSPLVSASAPFQNTGSKGLPAGWFITYPK
jgi:hypothetical protein